MIIIKSKQYIKSHKKYILDKHLEKEILRISNIENLIISSSNLNDLVNNEYKYLSYRTKEGAFKRVLYSTYK